MHFTGRKPTAEELTILRALIEAGGWMYNEKVNAMSPTAWACVERMNTLRWVIVTTSVHITDEGREAAGSLP